MKSVTGLSSIHALFDILLVDLNGVIHDGNKPYTGVGHCLTQLKEAGKKIVFLSNMPRGGDVAMEKLRGQGLDVEGCDILTSGDMVREQLKNPTDPVFLKLGKNFYHFGAENNQDLLAGLGIEAVDHLDKADYVILTKYMDWDETIAEAKDFLKDCYQRRLPIVSVNPDVSVIHEGRKRYTAGFLADAYGRMGGTVYSYGKPHTQAYQTIFDRYGHQPTYLMVGDSLDTDIQGASQAGIPSLLVMTGNTGYTLEKEPETSLKQYIQQHGKAMPTYVAPSFIW